jgi:glycosyltransferase involved in cell wall biosynthesis
MRLALVMSHADRRMEGARRELHWLAALAARGVSVWLFRIHRDDVSEDVDLLDGRVPASFRPADDATLPHMARTSVALAAAIRDFAPDLLLMKGLGYGLNTQLVAALGCPHGVIAGGLTRDPVVPGAAVVLAEHQGQLEGDFAVQHAAGRALILPKYFDPTLVGEGPPTTPDFPIVNVGSFTDARKNQVALLPFTKRHRVLFLGGGPLLEQVRARATPRARFAGARRPEDVYTWLRRSRLMVHPALQEGLPRAVVEAMACGLPVVAYRHVIPAGIRHGETGLLVTPETLEAEVEALLADPPRLHAMALAARADAFATHGPAAIERSAEAFLGLAVQLFPSTA